MSEENSSPFKITDRRLFNADGSLREDAPEREVPASPPVVSTAPAPPPKPSFSAADITGAKAAPVPPPPPPAPPLSPAATAAPAFAQPEADFDDADLMGQPEQTLFTEFLMRTASEAFIYLGLVPHPMSGRPQLDLPAAKEVIDMIVMLREKTNGNLTPGEARFMESLLGDLQMQFVSLRQQAQR